MPSRNPALSASVVGRVQLYYKDANEALTYSVDVGDLLASNENVDPNSVVISVLPNDATIDFSFIADSSSITLYVDVGGTLHTTYEFTIKFNSDLNNEYVDYMRMNIKQVYKECS